MSERSTWPMLSLAAAWALVLAAGIGAGWWIGERHEAKMRLELKRDATSAAVAFATEDTAALTASAADRDSPAYASVKRRLMALREANQGVRFAYLFRTAETPGRVVFLADSEPPGSAEESKPGDDYPEALASPGLQALLRDRQPGTEGPLRDSFGEWVTGYAVVGRNPPGAPMTILGLDVETAEWNSELATARLTAAVITWCALGLALAGWWLARRDLRRGEDLRRLSTALQQSQTGFLMVNLQFIVEYVNEGGASALGWRPDELIGQPTSIFVPPGTDDAMRDQVSARLRAGERWQGEFSMQHKDGRPLPVRAVVSPVRDGGKVTSLVAIFEDISDLKQAEVDLRRARDEAQAADRAKGEFLAVMSHELRTPLNGIIGFAGLLKDTPLSPEQQDYVDTIQQSGQALLALTNDLLDYSRIDAGRLSLDPQPCSPRAIVEESVEIMATRAAEKHLELLTSVSPDVPAHVLADPGRLRQVLVNLLGNAIKFTPSGEIEIVLETAPTPPAAGTQRICPLVVTVRDSGIGISPEQQNRLFQPFTQLESSSTRRYGGAGLGLAISRSLVRLMGGDISVESAAGAGAAFRFEIPVPWLEDAPPLAALPPATVALVAPNPRARQHFSSLLQGWGLRVFACPNLLTLPARGEFDLLVVDVLTRDAALWPGLLRATPAAQDCPSVGLVALSVPGAVRDELRSGFRSILKKPVREPLLHALLLSLLRK